MTTGEEAADLAFGTAAFLSAALVFWAEPMVGRMLLPSLGGSPAVWNTVLVFFQAILLAGYLYAHLSATRLSSRTAIPLHLVLLAGGAVCLPLSLNRASAPFSGNPVVWLASALLRSTGLPVLALSATAPLLQSWFAGSGRRTGRDPYFLYGFSNAGSLAGLLAYPLLLEPSSGLGTHNRVWSAMYVAFACLMAWCARAAFREGTREDRPAADAPPPAAPAGRDRLRWLVLAAVPSSLLLGVTSHLTVDLPPTPLLWVVPLALYLVSFIIVFARRPPTFLRRLAALKPAAILALAIVMAASPRLGLGWRAVLPLHLATFLVIAIAFHGRLSDTRPAPAHLTSFYLWMAAGGVLGGLFNALAAPLLFRTTAEYPLMLVAACLLGSHGGRTAPAGGTLLPEKRPLTFGLGIAAILLVGAADAGWFYRVVQRDRDYFGTVKVEAVRDYGFKLVHGQTMHGAQDRRPEYRRTPLAYYSEAGPLGHVFFALEGALEGARIAVTGLGAGVVAAYGRSGQRIDFYEISPAVIRTATDTRFFTYLADTPAEVRIIAGDARIRLAEAPDDAYALIVADTFSSERIPVHLLTREALRLYLSKLRPGGLLVFHLSNIHLDLEPVLADLARSEGLLCQVNYHSPPVEGDRDVPFVAPSIWMAIGRSLTDFGNLPYCPGWQLSPGRPDRRLWTDDFANVLGTLRALARD